MVQREAGTDRYRKVLRLLRIMHYHGTISNPEVVTRLVLAVSWDSSTLIARPGAVRYESPAYFVISAPARRC